MRLALLFALLVSLAGADGICLGALVARDAAFTLTPAFGVAALAWHLGFAAAGAAVFVLSVPKLTTDSTLALGLLALALGLFLPVLGVLGLALAVRFGVNHKRGDRRRPWQSLDPSVSLHAPPRVAHRNVVASDLVSALSDRSPENAEHRFQVLLLTRHLSPRIAISILKLAMKDPSDEVRLFAFSRIERFRASIESNIKTLTAAKEGAIEDAARVELRLAENHWELGYLHLVEGTVRLYALQNARKHAMEAIVLSPEAAPAHFMLARILLALAEYVPASASFYRAINLGYPRKRVLPYLAECAFRRREFDVVKPMLREVASKPEEHFYLSPVVDIWL